MMMMVKMMATMRKRTRLTYNCAHLRSTKESLMFEYFDIYFFIERYDKILKTCISDWDLTLHS